MEDKPSFYVILIVPNKGRKREHLREFFRQYPEMRDFARFKVLTPNANIAKQINRYYRKVYYFKSLEKRLDIKNLRLIMSSKLQTFSCVLPVNV